ncbi:trefoil factor 1 [Balaenoptera acutorostrata]|uniref:Trefoil factor 1 n=1 Tax=Balaenoptera acutorostrata TaxID=9767 RepID=A0A383ZC13_BALAC|nr:trefoil factor 1 [Balaenoptera acutorostrata]
MEPKVTCVLVMVFALALSSLAQGEAETCQMGPHQRVNCGEPGITPTECKAKGCCFDSNIFGVPWCFHPVAIDEPSEGECQF